MRLRGTLDHILAGAISPLQNQAMEGFYHPSPGRLSHTSFSKPCTRSIGGVDDDNGRVSAMLCRSTPQGDEMEEEKASCEKCSEYLEICSSPRDISKSECHFVGPWRAKINTSVRRSLLSLAVVGHYVRWALEISATLSLQGFPLPDKPLKRHRLKHLSGT